MGRLKPGHGNNSPSMWSSCKHTYRCGKSIKNSLHVFVSYFPQEATDFPMFLWFTRKSNAASQWIGHLFPMIFPMYINVYHISITQSGNSCFCRHIQTSSSSWSCMYIYIYCTLYIPLNPIESSLWSVAYPLFLAERFPTWASHHTQVTHTGCGDLNFF